jgi:hypothetical protein
MSVERGGSPDDGYVVVNRAPCFLKMCDRPHSR